jgi:hypothetical protein
MVGARSEFLIDFMMEFKTLVVAHIRSYSVVFGRRKSLLSSQSLETLVRVADEGQAHFSGMLVASLRSLRAQSITVIVLVDFVYREVLRVNVRLQLGLEWGADATKAVPLHAAEEGMLLDFVSAVGTADST